MAADYGAHEVMELHEVLTDVVDGINQFELYRPHVTDQQLSSLLDKQINFMTQEYNETVQALNQRGIGNLRPYQANINNEPLYGLDNPKTQSPNTSARRMDNRDVASGMLGCLKSSSILKSMACLECADLSLRRMIQQGATNCSEMAYEIWQYMNQNGYYQVPTMKQMTTDTLLNAHVPANTRNMTTMNNMNNMNAMNVANNIDMGQTANFNPTFNAANMANSYSAANDISMNFGNAGNQENKMPFASYNTPNNNIPSSNNLNAGGFILQ